MDNICYNYKDSTTECASDEMETCESTGELKGIVSARNGENSVGDDRDVISANRVCDTVSTRRDVGESRRDYGFNEDDRRRESRNGFDSWREQKDDTGDSRRDRRESYDRRNHWGDMNDVRRERRDVGDGKRDYRDVYNPRRDRRDSNEDSNRDQRDTLHDRRDHRDSNYDRKEYKDGNVDSGKNLRDSYDNSNHEEAYCDRRDFRDGGDDSKGNGGDKKENRVYNVNTVPTMRLTVLRRARPRPNKAPRYSDDLSLFVNNLSDDVTSESLLAGFATKYQIVSAKVLMRNDGRSKGCGFVRFYSEFELQKSLTEMQHMTGIGKNPIRVRFAYKNPPSKEFGGSYSPSVNPYYPYHNYQNVWVPSSSQTLSTTPQSDYENYYQYPYPYPAATEPITYPYETFEDEVLEEPILEDDVEQVNKQFMEKNEEFYIALEESRWQNVDDIMDPRITV